VRHGHVLKGRPASGHYASRQLCECSLTDACHLLVSISEGVPPHYHTAAVQTQRAVRQWLATRELKRRQQAKWQLRHHVATRTWQAAVTDPIWRVVTEATASRQLAYERASMAVCDGKSAAARKYLKLQVHNQNKEAIPSFRLLFIFIFLRELNNYPCVVDFDTRSSFSSLTCLCTSLSFHNSAICCRLRRKPW